MAQRWLVRVLVVCLGLLGPHWTFAAGGAVATAHPLATAAAAQVLRDGGTAIDAAVAAALVLGVVNPQSSGLGGGGFAVWRESDGTVGSLDFRESAPSFFVADTFAQPERDSARGAWSVGLPGEPAGLAALHKEGGRLPWARLVDPARILAQDGFPVSADLAAALGRRSAEVLRDPGLASDFASGRRVFVQGELCRRSALGRTLAWLGEHGGDGFYRGPLAVSIEGFLRRSGAPWPEGELKNYKVRVREPLRATTAGRTVVGMGPPSSGGFTIMETLGILEAAGHPSMERGSLPWVRTLVGALRHGFADRATYGSDPDRGPFPRDALLDPALHQRLAARIPAKGPVALREAGLAAERGDLASLLPTDGGTSHLSVMDGEGGAVALTTTVNLDLGALIQDPHTGILLNDEMDDFATHPGVPNAFGLVQSARNAPSAGMRPLSSMSPTLVLDDQGRAVLAVGGAGGPRIISGTLLALLDVVHHGSSLDQALAAPRVHHQWLPDQIDLEPGFAEATAGALRAEGFRVEPGQGRAVVQAVAWDPKTGQWSAAADPRAGGSAEVLAP